MGSEQPLAASKVGTLFNFLERLLLFALSLSVGLVNLLIGLAVAAHLGVIPKAAGGKVLRVASQATAFVTKIMEPSRAPAPQHKAKR